MKDEDKPHYFLENLRIVRIPQDVTKITRKTREETYFLTSLLNLEEIYLGINSVAHSKYRKLAEALLTDFDALEEQMYFGRPDMAEVSAESLVKNLIEYIKLRVKIVDIQIEMLAEMTNYSKDTIDRIVKSDSDFQKYDLEIRSSLLTESALHHSYKENMLKSFVFVEDEENYDTSLNPDTSYNRIKVENKDYVLKKNRKTFKLAFDQMTKLIFNLNDIKKQTYFENLNKKQFAFNRQVTILTWIVSIATIITFILSLMEISNKYCH